MLRITRVRQLPTNPTRRTGYEHDDGDVQGNDEHDQNASPQSYGQLTPVSSSPDTVRILISIVQQIIHGRRTRLSDRRLFTVFWYLLLV
jgi:hypothetical protein